MTLYNIPANTTDPSQLAVGLSSALPRLSLSILILIYIVITLAGYMSEERQKGRARFAFWLTIAGLITTTISFIMFLIDGLIGLEIIISCMAITFLSAMAFFVATRD